MLVYITLVDKSTCIKPVDNLQQTLLSSNQSRDKAGGEGVASKLFDNLDIKWGRVEVKRNHTTENYEDFM